MDAQILKYGSTVVITIDTPGGLKTFDFSALVYYFCKEIDTLEYLGARVNKSFQRVDVFTYKLDRKEQLFALDRWEFRSDVLSFMLFADDDILDETEPIEDYRYKVINCIPHLEVCYFKDFSSAQEFQQFLGESAVLEEI